MIGLIIRSLRRCKSEMSFNFDLYDVKCGAFAIKIQFSDSAVQFTLHEEK